MEVGSILDLSQPSISHHIKKLVEAGLIELLKAGRYFNYSLNAKTWEEYLIALTALHKS